MTAHGYVLVKRPEHPLADCRGYIYEHRLVACEKIGRLLRPGEIAHHKNHDRTDNRPENIEIVPSIAHHLAEHRKPGSDLQMPDEPNKVVSCECGCGARFDKYDQQRRPRRFVSGHNLHP